MAKPARSVDTTVRVDRATSSAIADLACETGVARKEVVALAVERLRRHRILESTNTGFAAIKRDARVWREELDERESWESTVADGLGDE